MYRLAIILLFCASAFAQEIVSAPVAPAAPEAIVKAVADRALTFKIAANEIQLWPAKSIAGEKNAVAGALYPDLPRGALAGVIHFSTTAEDFRGQKIPAGTYTLRYATLPADGNHLGVAPAPDFFLLVPVANDADPSAPIAYPRLIKLSTRASGTNHPAAFSLTAPSTKSPSTSTNEKGHIAVTFTLKNVNGKSVDLALIVSGQAEQ
jgi:hypothetical protein